MNESELKQFRNDFIDLLNDYKISVVEVVENPGCMAGETYSPEIVNSRERIVFIARDGRQEISFPSLIFVKDFKKL